MFSIMCPKKYSASLLSLLSSVNIQSFSPFFIGDTVLSEVASVINTTLREQDSVSRWGGEEFLALLPETDLNGAKKVCENLREKVEDYKYNQGGEKLNITISLGQHVLAIIQQ